MLRWTKRLRRGIGGADWVSCANWEGSAIERFWCDTFGFAAVVAGVLRPLRRKGYHDVRTQKPYDPTFRTSDSSFLRIFILSSDNTMWMICGNGRTSAGARSGGLSIPATRGYRT